ncbi:MAG: MFS transporter [Gammaproteobacteria bacterium]|nr:MFS transporter [Gammaproteobacteria bacterium]MDH5277406.1 MFS transporter [Gammaproteobacteria bacterium]
MQDPETPGLPLTVRLGPFWFAPGWSRGNATTVWFASFFTIGLAAFMSFLQPYLLNEVLHIPVTEQGRLTGNLGFLQEVVVIALAGLVGAWSDRVGRRRVYCLGFGLMAAGLVIYPFASNQTELVLYRIAFAMGIAVAPLMLSACVVDASQEKSRGKWVASNNLLQGLGVVAMAVGLANLPLWFAGRGADAVSAGRYAFWTAAAIALLAAAVMAVGLPRTIPRPATADRPSLWASIGRAARLGAANPRLAIAYCGGFIGRGDFVVVGSFFSLWITQAGIASGMSPAASVARAGMFFGLLQLAGMGWAFFMGIIADRVNRVTGVCIAYGLAAGSYLLLGQVADPFAGGFLPIVIFVGIGEISVIVATGALLGQEAPLEERGPVVGLFNASGGLGILFATAAGGYVFDRFGPTAPFTMMAVLNAALLAAAIAVRRFAPARAAPHVIN